MNVFTACLVSTKKQATYAVSTARQFLATYLLKVSAIDGDLCRFEIFTISHPDYEVSKGPGKPLIAEQAHFSQDLNEAQLLAMLTKHFSVDGWEPVENENR